MFMENQFDPNNEVIIDEVKSPEAKSPKKKRRFFRGIAMLVLIVFISGITFGSGYFIALKYGDVLNARLINSDLAPEDGNSIHINQIQPIVSETDGSGTSVSTIAEQVGPAVVTVTNHLAVSNNQFYGLFGDAFGNSEGSGSGILFKVDKDYLYVLTNHHVIDGAQSLDVTFQNGETLSVEALGFDSTMDIAVLALPIDKVNEVLDSIVIATFGDSDSLQVGEVAVAIGSPLGLEFSNSVTVGVISATNRTLLLSNDQEQVNLIQTDAAINPGNSGGALVNGQGEIIGINTAKYSDTSVEGMGFAIPINDALPVIDSILASRSGSDVAYEMTADKPFLGVEIAAITSEIYQQTGATFGVYVSGIFEGGAAEKAGIQTGDVIYMLDDKRVANPEALVTMLGKHQVGDTIKLGVIRGENIISFEATLTAYGDVVKE